ncbi:allatostatin-A receptor-like [Lingula anatina]|uniref:Allatostatin-A receptor-like n=1 Tax=Lingula anatina TaxID=7574 RepID=A0A1S3HKJ0_LINAN|nr:allatostatin-A receptor-like [Lingula anatina]|eukprot:XP_013385981.1 allatostatin-A receptor-like [Lingula anatina]
METYFDSLPDIFTIINFIIISIGIIGNLLVLLIIICRKTTRTKMYILIGNLAVADLSFLAQQMVVFVTKIPEKIYFLYNYMTFVTVTVSIHTLVLLALDKFMSLVLVYTSRVFKTTRNLFITVVLLWAVSIVAFYMPVTIFFDSHPGFVHQNGPYMTRNLTFDIDTTPYRITLACFFVFDFMLPLITMTVMYSMVIHQLLCKDRPNPGNSSAEMKVVKDKQRLTVVMMIVTIVFVVCWFPKWVNFYFLFFTDVDDRNESYMLFLKFTHLLVVINSAINPILYAFIYVDFRRGVTVPVNFMRKLCCNK